MVSELHRGRTPVGGPAFDALVARLAAMFAFPRDELTHMHLTTAPEDVRVVNFDALARRCYPDDPQHRFVEADVDAVLEDVPATEPISPPTAAPRRGWRRRWARVATCNGNSTCGRDGCARRASR